MEGTILQTERLAEREEDVSYLRNRLDYDEVLGALGISVSHHQGDWIMCHCPNPYGHSNGDSNPSFGFNTAEMRYNCFVCGGGSLLTLVKDQLALSDKEAVNWLQQMSSFEPAQREDLREKINKIIHPVREKDILPEYPDAAVFKYRFIHPYLLDRGISRETIIEMNVGYDEEHLGIIIPHWWQGKLRGWQVRHLLSEKVNGKDIWYCPTCGGYNSPTVATSAKKVAKYNNTHNFPKKHTLYAYDKMIEEGHSSVIVVESPMSVLYLRSHGFPNVVATFGSWNIEQLSLLAKFKTVWLWPDNDYAGVENLTRVVGKLRQLTDVKIVPVVDREHGDPGDVAPEKLATYIEAAISPALMPFFKGSVPTLEAALANTK